MNAPNHSLHRTPPRNVLAQAITLVCVMSGTLRRYGCWGGAGEFEKR